MKDYKRASLAVIGATLLSGRDIKSIYCRTSKEFKSVEAEMVGNKVKVYDFEHVCFEESNSPSSGVESWDNDFLEINVGEGQVSGYDYCANSSFEITLSGKRVDLVDFEFGQRFTYTVAFFSSAFSPS